MSGPFAPYTPAGTIANASANETFALPARGDLSARIHGAENIMRERAASARAAAAGMPKDSPAAAALRGKAQGYYEAADLLRRLDHGDRLPPKSHRWSRRARA